MAAENSKFSKLITRSISGIILVLSLFFILNIGGIVLFMACLLLSLAGLYELFNVFSLAPTSLAFVSYFSTIFYYCVIYFNKSSYILHFIIIYLIVLLIFYVLKYPKFHIKDLSICFFGVVYVPIMFSFIYLIRLLPYGQYLVWLVFIASWGCDTCAYLTGLLCGKHKAFPVLSPNKTIEGCIGGVVGAGILGILYYYILSIVLKTNMDISILPICITCMAGAILSQFGDLAASGIKRDNNIKDYGDLIPGHGGVLDRFDSVIFTSVAIYMILLFV